MAILLNEKGRGVRWLALGLVIVDYESRGKQTREFFPSASLSMPIRSLLNRFTGQPKPQARIGCGFLIVSTLLTCVLLGINGLIVLNVYHASRAGLPESFRRPQVEQASVFLGP